MGFKIAIIGAGPAGCMLARLLHASQQQIDVLIFESEASLDFRSQGGTLDLHAQTGQAALKQAGLLGAFEEKARYDGEAMKIVDKRLVCYINQGPSKQGSMTGRPEIDRPQLRELLYRSLPDGVVKWSKKLAQVDAATRELHFADGTDLAGFDLIVGADGAWSRTRPCLSPVQPHYSGIGGYVQVIPDAQRTQPHLYRLVNRGSLFAFSDGKSIIAQFMAEGCLQVLAWRVLPEHWQEDGGDNVRDPAAAKAALRKEYAGWDPRLLDFIDKASDAPADLVARNLYMLPVGHRWEHREGVTLIGDAAHLMTPFAGEGVNLALEDSMKLADAIVAAAAAAATTGGSGPDAKAVLDEKVAAFEADMFVRAKHTQQLTVSMMHNFFFEPGAPRDNIAPLVITAIRDQVGPLVATLIAPLVYIYFFIFKLIW